MSEKLPTAEECRLRRIDIKRIDFLLNAGRDLPWKATDKNAVTDTFGWPIFVDENNGTAAKATAHDAEWVAMLPDISFLAIRQAQKIERLQTALSIAEEAFYQGTGHDLMMTLKIKGIALDAGDMQ